MKAAVLYGREDVRVEQVEVPRLEAGDVLLRTRVALTCGTDAKVFRRGYHARMIVPPAGFGPEVAGGGEEGGAAGGGPAPGRAGVVGREVAGVVEEVGPAVEGLEPGTAVVAANSAPCGECWYCRHDMSNLC